MSNGGADPAASSLRALFDGGSTGGLSDGELLDRFVARRDEAAVAALVGRHGPMVLGVCRRVLGDPHDADDAFQATFLVLARRASTVRPSGHVARWLHGVATRTARKARALRARRRGREITSTRIEAEAAIGPDPTPDLDRADLRDRLDRAIAGLPARYRAPVVLCLLEGRTHREAADFLGWPVGTVAGRLSRGRHLLARRLRVGDGPEPTTPGPLPPIPPVPLPLGADRVVAVARIAILYGTGRPALVPVGLAPVLTLTSEVIRTMMLTKFKLAAALLLGAGLLIGGVVGLTRPSPAAARADDRIPPEPDLAPLQGVWQGVLTERDNGPASHGPDDPAPPVNMVVRGDQMMISGIVFGWNWGFDPRMQMNFQLSVPPAVAKGETGPGAPRRVAGATAEPTPIDLTLPATFDDIAPTSYPGLYQIDGDTLRLCFSQHNKRRPARLATEPWTRQLLLELRRTPTAVLPGNSSSPAPAARPLGEPKLEVRADRDERRPAEYSKRDQRPAIEDEALAKLIPGRLVGTEEVNKDAMILSYLPDWDHGDVDNLGIGNNHVGVRTLVDWPTIGREVAGAANRRFYLAFYARTTHSEPGVPGRIVAAEIQEAWPERVSWRNQPDFAGNSATTRFEPGEGWKLFDVTELIRARARENRLGWGIMLRFDERDVPSTNARQFSDYQMVSREATGEWRSKRPRIIIVEPTDKPAGK